MCAAPPFCSSSMHEVLGHCSLLQGCRVKRLHLLLSRGEVNPRTSRVAACCTLLQWLHAWSAGPLQLVAGVQSVKRLHLLFVYRGIGQP